MPVRSAIVGMGMIGTTHASILRALPDAELVAVADSDPARLSDFSELHTYRSGLELLEQENIDALWICTPPSAHLALATAALERGIDVFCEKPVADSIDDAQRMLDASRSSSGLLAVGHTLRFHPDVQALAASVREGRLGDIVQAHARWATNDAEGVLLSGRVSIPLEMSVHHLDVLGWCLGEVKDVYARASSIAPCGPGPDAVSAVLTFESGATAALEHSWIMPASTGVSSDQRLAFFGTRGTGYFDAQRPFTQEFATTGTRMAHTAYRGFDHAVPAGALANTDRHFLAAVRGDLEWPVPVEDAVRALRLALAMDESIASGLPVQMGSDHAD